MRVFISGQKYFAESILRICLKEGHTVVGVCCPPTDRYIGQLASTFNIKSIPAGSLNYDTMPKDVDLGICAHSFDYIGKKTRYVPKYGWIGFHPSLLPRHRGRSSIEWAIRMRDAITGGTWYWLNSGIDRGDIAYQGWCFIDPKLYSMSAKEAAAILWRASIQDIGVTLFTRAIKDISKGEIKRAPQDCRFSTWEPGTAVSDIYRPDALMLEYKP